MCKWCQATNKSTIETFLSHDYIFLGAQLGLCSFLKGFFPLWNMLSQAVIIQAQGGAKYSRLRKTHSPVVELVQAPCYVLESTGSVHHASGVRWQHAVGLCKGILWPQYITIYKYKDHPSCMKCVTAPLSKIRLPVGHKPLTQHLHFDSIYILAIWF